MGLGRREGPSATWEAALFFLPPSSAPSFWSGRQQATKASVTFTRIFSRLSRRCRATVKCRCLSPAQWLSRQTGEQHENSRAVQVPEGADAAGPGSTLGAAPASRIKGTGVAARSGELGLHGHLALGAFRQITPLCPVPARGSGGPVSVFSSLSSLSSPFPFLEIQLPRFTLSLILSV